MNQTNSIEKGYVMLLVGTRKEAFIVSSDESWKDWSVAAPTLTPTTHFMSFMLAEMEERY